MISPRLLTVAGLIAFATVLPLSLGCGGGDSKSSDTGLSPAELAKMMEDTKAETAKVLRQELAAKEALELLTADPPAGASAKEAFAGKRRTIIGKLIERSAEKSDSPFLTIDGGTHKGKAYKVKFNFSASQSEEITPFKLGDVVRVEGTTDGELKDDTLAFTQCEASAVTPPPMPPAGGTGVGERPVPK